MDRVDRDELQDMVSRLTACLDEHRFDDIVAMFVPDATAATPGGSVSGRDAVVAQATRNHVGFTALQHLVTNVLVEVDPASGGDTASVRANLVGIFIKEPPQPEFALGAVYRFTARRTPEGWRFASLTVTPVWRMGTQPVLPPAGE